MLITACYHGDVGGVGFVGETTMWRTRIKKKRVHHFKKSSFYDHVTFVVRVNSLYAHLYMERKGNVLFNDGTSAKRERVFKRTNG